MTYTLQELADTIYLEAADRVLDELETLEYTAEYCSTENLRYALAKLIKNTIIGNVIYNRVDSANSNRGDG